MGGRYRRKKRPILVSIAGGSASGKTTVAKKIQEKLGKDRVVIIEQDNYYKGWAYLPMSARERINFDSPEAIDILLLIRDLKRLLKGETINMPLYCYETHTRKKRTLKVRPKEVIILEGIFAFASKPLRNLADLKVYVEVGRDICFIRRLKRDIKLRGETVNSVVKRYLEQVRPMHFRYVEPTKKFADIVISGEAGNSSDIKKILSEIRHLRRKK